MEPRRDVHKQERLVVVCCVLLLLVHCAVDSRLGSAGVGCRRCFCRTKFYSCSLSDNEHANNAVIMSNIDKRHSSDIRELYYDVCCY